LFRKGLIPVTFITSHTPHAINSLHFSRTHSNSSRTFLLPFVILVDSNQITKEMMLPME
jgi:hypothetical protein